MIDDLSKHLKYIYDSLSVMKKDQPPYGLHKDTTEGVSDNTIAADIINAIKERVTMDASNDVNKNGHTDLNINDDNLKGDSIRSKVEGILKNVEKIINDQGK